MNYYRANNSDRTAIQGHTGYAPGVEAASAADAVDAVEIYGEYLWRYVGNRHVAADDIASDIANLVGDAGDINPADIIDHCGMWDDDQAVSDCWHGLLEERDIWAVTTQDGIMSFDAGDWVLVGKCGEI